MKFGEEVIFIFMVVGCVQWVTLGNNEKEFKNNNPILIKSPQDQSLLSHYATEIKNLLF
jgi:hypothetical protein